MQYGMPYMGSKSGIAVDIINQLPSGKRFVDLFGGGFAISHCALLSGKYENVYYNELNPLVVDLLKRALNGDFNYNKFKPKFIKREEFMANKEKDGYIKYIWSFGNQGDSYLFGKDVEHIKEMAHNFVVFNKLDNELHKMLPDIIVKCRGNTIKERRLKLYQYAKELNKGKDIKIELQQLQQLQQLQRLERLQRLELHNEDYKKYKYKKGDVVYLDPPYENTKKYDNNVFNYKEFYDWVASRPYNVYFSSYAISDKRFKLIYSKYKRSLLAIKNKKVGNVECLYYHKGGLNETK